MLPDKTHYTLNDAAELLSCSPGDVLHLAVQRKLTLLIGRPDRIDVRVFEEQANKTYPPFLQQPDLLALSQSSCLKIETTGKTDQSDFPAGYLLDSRGQLNKLLPSYGRPELQSQWTHWRTYRDDKICLITIGPEQLFVSHIELATLFKQRDQAGTKSKARKSTTTVEEPTSETDKPTVHADQTPTAMGEAVAPAAPVTISKMLRLKDVIARTGLSRSTIYDKINPKSRRYDSAFPKQVSLGVASVGWVESEITNWIDGRPQRERIPQKNERPAGSIAENATDEIASPLTRRVVRLTKERRNELDSAIEQAIQRTPSGHHADVFTELREMALTGIAPFTGIVDSKGICYTTSTNKIASLSPTALADRIRRRMKKR